MCMRVWMRVCCIYVCSVYIWSLAYVSVIVFIRCVVHVYFMHCSVHVRVQCKCLCVFLWYIYIVTYIRYRPSTMLYSHASKYLLALEKIANLRSMAPISLSSIHPALNWVNARKWIRCHLVIVCSHFEQCLANPLYSFLFTEWNAFIMVAIVYCLNGVSTSIHYYVMMAASQCIRWLQFNDYEDTSLYSIYFSTQFLFWMIFICSAI